MGSFGKSNAAISNLITANGFTVKQDPSGNLGFYYGGTEKFSIDQTGSLLFNNVGNAGTNSMPMGFMNSLATFAKYNNIATAGLGLSAIYTAYASGSQNAALTAVGSYTPPATAGRYRVTANVYCTVGTTTTFSVKVNYKDLNGTSHADILPLVSAAAPGVFLLNGLVIAAGTYYAMPIEIDIDNSQTPITFSTVGTFTTVTYFLNATLEQLS
jgi:hypothetical protein